MAPALPTWRVRQPGGGSAGGRSGLSTRRPTPSLHLMAVGRSTGLASLVNSVTDQLPAGGAHGLGLAGPLTAIGVVWRWPGVGGKFAARCVDGGPAAPCRRWIDVHHLHVWAMAPPRNAPHGPHYSPSSWATIMELLAVGQTAPGRYWHRPNSTLQMELPPARLPRQPTLKQHLRI